MIEILGLTLLRPLWLLALPIIAVLAAVALRRDAMSGWRRLIDSRLAPHLRALGHIRPAGRDRRVVWLAAAAMIAALALTGPATRSASAPLMRSLDTVVIAVDLSRSVTEGGGLESVRGATARLIDAASGRPVALVLYAADAYLASPPADDPRLLETLVAVMDSGTMPDEGSRPDRALSFAGELLQGAAQERRDVVLISDGGGIGPEAEHEARILSEAGITLSTVFVAPSETPYGMPAPQGGALAALAKATGGWSVDATDVQPLANRLAPRRPGEIPREFTTVSFDDHGRTILLFALLPALLLFRRRG